jgi:hypothetical protein
VIHSIHRRVLDHIKRESERARRSQASMPGL